MERIILINDKKRPSDFNLVDVIPPSTKTKIQYVEEKIIDAVNNHFPNMNVNRIEYGDYKSHFPYYQNYVNNGMIIEECEIDPSLSRRYSSNNSYIYTKSGKTFCRSILLYLFISPSTEEWRNSLISQTVFPSLLDYAERFLTSPSYSIANHDFCYINVITKQITAKTILSPLVALCKMGMHYVEVFNSGTLNTNTLPKTLRSFFEQYYDMDTYYNDLTDIYEDDDFCVDFSNKTIKVKCTKLIAGLTTSVSGVTQFHGSSEKFIQINMFPISIMAYNFGYNVDFSEYDRFITTYGPMFSSSSDKMHRFEIMLNYLRKYIK